MSKQIKYLRLIFLMIGILTACRDNETIDPENQTDLKVELKEPNESEIDYNFDSSAATNITLRNTTVEITGPGAVFSGSTITISAAGVYNVSGVLTNGQLLIESDDTENVNLLLNGVNITNKTSSAISITKAEKVVVNLVDGTVNTLTDGTYASSDEKNATLYSKSDLSFFGKGKLIVNANYQDGIVSKDGLIIESGVFEVKATDDAIRGKDYVLIHDGTFDLQAGGDALASDNDEDADRGYVTIENGTFQLVSGADGIQAMTVLSIENGEFIIQTGGGSTKSISSTASAKALKAGVKLLIQDGQFTIEAADDALHSNQYLVVDGGELDVKTSDDGAHADEALTINGGSLLVSKSYEGLESKIITINGGDIRVTTSDDGINVTDGSSSGGMGGGFPGGGSSGTASAFLYIRGGFVVVNASGDGLDANGAIEMTGGTVLVHGPTQNNNGALDYDYTFKLTGGTLVAVGSSGMAQAPGSISTQKYTSLRLTQTAGSTLDIRDNTGNSMLCFKSMKSFQSIVLSSPKFASGTYDVYAGGSSDGPNEGGLISGGTYSGGSKASSFSL